MPRLAVAVMATAWVAVLGTGPAPGPAPAGARVATGAGAGAEEHRAAVIVDTGTQVKSVCVRFREESITGIEALQRAAVDPVLRAFPGKGAAVCSLCGTGCPADESCLTCDTGGRFWSYSRAPAGTTALRVSGVGASSTTVRDGDVEGWRWGLGGAPAHASVEQVCGEAVPVAPSTTSAPAPPAAGPATTAAPATTTTSALRVPVTRGATASTTTRPPGGARPTAAPAPSPPGGGATSPSAPAAPTTRGDESTATTPHPGDLAASSAPDDGGGGDGWAGVAGFGAVLAGLLAWTAVTRRRRRDGR